MIRIEKNCLNCSAELKEGRTRNTVTLSARAPTSTEHQS